MKRELILPGSFDAADTAFRRSPAGAWESGERALRHFGSRTVMCSVPLFWQTLPSIHAASRAVGAAVLVCDPTNAPLAAAAISLAEADTIVVASSDAFALSSYFSGKHIWPASWLLIHQATGAWEMPAPLRERMKVAQEIHLAPGVVALDQCEALMDSKLPHFHAVLSNLPFALENAGVCVCGNDIFTKKTI